MDSYIRKLVPVDGDGPFGGTFETINLEVKRLQCADFIPNEYLDRPDAQAYVDMVTNRLRRELGRLIDLSGHEPYGELETHETPDMMRNGVTLVWVQHAIERIDGQWRSIHEARRQDLADLAEAEKEL